MQGPKELLSSSKLATGISAHTKGESFDIDGAGYYQGEEAINPRFTKDYDSRCKPEVHEMLENVLDQMENEGKLGYIKEFAGTGNQSFHVTRNPNYKPNHADFKNKK